ncbi:hypothetical protein [Actinoplanes aureus]|uniref:Uncharacterized protein n=1 Tax=Actinoplanes aureus TaxID=2792083 RepID=A0A931CB30_9ACTN|nr:hypothetical protein [Actinoplanes aureus]MBG0561610.1 hypothetical protein [Actinoplanes aureus]
MADRNVLILALGGTRRRAALDDAALVTADGGNATVVVGDTALWRNDKPAPGVRLVAQAELELRHTWLRWEQLMLYRLPRRALKGRSDRAWQAYRRRVADKLHRKVFLPLARRGSGDRTARLIRRYETAMGKLDVLVVNDPASMPVAVSLLRTYGGTELPQVAYGIGDR